MDRHDIDRRIRKVLVNDLSLDLDENELEHSNSLADLVGLDSITVLEFVVGLEREFQTKFDSDHLDMELLGDLEKLSQYIAERMERPS